MKNQLHKDKNKRNFSLKFEKKHFILKSLMKNTNTIKTLRWNTSLKLTSLDLKHSFVKTVNRCILTGRKNKFNKNFKFSRLTFLKLARNGYINGLFKSSW